VLFKARRQRQGGRGQEDTGPEAEYKGRGAQAGEASRKRGIMEEAYLSKGRTEARRQDRGAARGPGDAYENGHR